MKAEPKKEASKQVEEVKEDPATFERIKAKLDEMGIDYKLTVHAPVKTSEEAAAIRGVSVDSGAKAMILKDSGKTRAKPGVDFYLCVVSASKRFDNKKFKKLTKVKGCRFATPEEVLEYSGCISGAVPPFGSLFTKPTLTLVDDSLAQQERINFNCGLRTHSMSILYSDYVKIEGVESTVNCIE